MVRYRIIYREGIHEPFSIEVNYDPSWWPWKRWERLPHFWEEKFKTFEEAEAWLDNWRKIDLKPIVVKTYE